MISFIPRPIYRVVLILIALGLSELAWIELSYKPLIYIAGSLGTLCFMIVGLIWSLKDKVDNLLNGDISTSGDFLRIRYAANNINRRSTVQLAWVLVTTTAAFSPTISGQFTGVIWQWMTLISFIGTAESIYSFLIVNSWLTQIKAVRDKQIFTVKQEAERVELIDKIKTSKSESSFDSWKIPH